MGCGFDEGADEIADHVVKEAVAANAVDEEVPSAAPGGVVDGASEGGGWEGGLGIRERIFADSWFAVCARSLFFAGGEVRVGGCEGGEVVSAEDVRCSLFKRGEVEMEAAGPDVGGEKGRADALVVIAGEDAVFVGFSQRAMTGVEVFGNGFDGEGSDAGGEGAVEGAMKIGGGDGAVEGEGGDLCECVDAGVGASGALGKNGFTGDAMNGFGECSLNGGEIGLDLPSVVWGSIVGEDELPVRHG